jgi:uncharacterized protein YdeI (YjbR/CyaY-like superfamily)
VSGVPFASADAWEAWLAAEHASSDGIWIRFAKKGSGVASVTYAEALEAALCYGWIDGQSERVDDSWFLQRFTPRRARSPWSRRNRDRALALIEEGRMQPAGLRELERAQDDGRWDAAYEGPATATVPDDLRRALDENPDARDRFATLDSRNRYAILYRVQEAKRPETRARRIATFVAMLAEGKTLHPYRPTLSTPRGQTPSQQ